MESLELHFPSAEIGEELRRVYDGAMGRGFFRIALAALELRMAYAYGKPVARQISANIDMDQFQAMFAPEDE